MKIVNDQTAVADKLFSLLDDNFKADIEDDQFLFYTELAELTKTYTCMDKILTKKTKKILKAWYAAMNAIAPIDEAEWAIEDEKKEKENPF